MKTIHLPDIIRLFLASVAASTSLASVLNAKGILNPSTIEEIHQQLNLTEDEASQLAVVRESYFERSGILKSQIPAADTPVARQDLVRQLTALALESYASVQQVLSAQQLEELQAHLSEPLGEAGKRQQPDYRQILNLTQEQALQFTALLTVYQPGIQELMTELQQARSMFKKRSISMSLKPLSEEMDLQVRGILDDQQYGQWKAIQAKRQAEMRKKLR